MSNQFIKGATYQMKTGLLAFMKIALQIQFSGDEGVFTVHDISDGTDGATKGSIYTDDITSPINKTRCCVPANIVHDCELIALVELVTPEEFLDAVYAGTPAAKVVH